ncbi:hypothetical protein SAMN04488026_11119 [Aliiruegeria lutimaris]|uniref:Uncharacterized protein n=1 Tax=Aliiruegeria lutimaris TaxID=571298 RepID=A0A1G9MJN0_9RHOB|nr:hypothetical protein SAMN04488026_11119 [Aliiruegeria lutimaris]
MTHDLTRSLLIVAALATPSLAQAHGPGPGNQQGPGWNGWQNPPCATTGIAVLPCGATPGARGYGPYGTGMPGPAAGHGPQMMQQYRIVPRRGTNWPRWLGGGSGWNWRN